MRGTFSSIIKTATALALMAALSCAPLAYAEGADDAPESTTKTYTYKSNEDKPTYPETIVVDGKTYKFASEDIRVIDEGLEMVACGLSQTKQCAPADLQATKDSFGNEALYDENGIKGNIPLVGIEEVAVTGIQEYECNRTVTYTGLSSNDASQIPVTTQAIGDTGNTVTLSRAGLTFEVESTDDRGVPKTYSAIATYRGVDAFEVIDYYDVTATYQGELALPNPTKTYEIVVTYKTDVAQDGGFANIAAIVAAAAALACIIGIPIWRRSNRVKFTHVTDDGKSSPKRVVVGSAHVKRTADGYVCDAKGIDLNVAGQTTYCALEMPKKYIDPSRRISVMQNGELAFSGPAEAKIKIL